MAEAQGTPRAVKPPSFVDAAIPLLALVVLVGTSVALFGLEAINGPMQVAMVLASMVAVAVILKNGHSWDEVARSGQKGIATIVGAIFILLAVGALIGTWNMSGTIPTLVYYGTSTPGGRPDQSYTPPRMKDGRIEPGILK